MFIRNYWAQERKCLSAAEPRVSSCRGKFGTSGNHFNCQSKEKKRCDGQKKVAEWKGISEKKGQSVSTPVPSWTTHQDGQTPEHRLALFGHGLREKWGFVPSFWMKPLLHALVCAPLCAVNLELGASSSSPAWLGLGSYCCGASADERCSESSASCLLSRQFRSSGLLVWHLFCTLNSHNTAFKNKGSRFSPCLVPDSKSRINK